MRCHPDSTQGGRSEGETDFVTTNVPKHLKPGLFKIKVSATETARPTERLPHFKGDFVNSLQCQSDPLVTLTCLPSWHKTYNQKIYSVKRIVYRWFFLLLIVVCVFSCFLFCGVEFVLVKTHGNTTSQPFWMEGSESSYAIMLCFLVEYPFNCPVCN